MFRQQINKAKKDIQRQKKINPHLFVQYHNYLNSKKELLIAEERYNLARKEWEEFGK